MILPTVPAVSEAGKPLTLRVAAAAACTMIPVSVPVMLGVSVSVAVIDLRPGCFERHGEELCSRGQPAKVKLAGKTACRSLLVRHTVPVYPVATLPYAS